MMHEYMEDGGLKTLQVPILTRSLTTELAGDFSLPDYQPEIKRLLRIGTNILPPNRFAGSDGVELQGMLDYYVLYMGHDNGVYCAPLSTEYAMRAETEMEGNTAIGEPLVCLCDAFAEPPTGRVTAPRRLHIRCKVKADVKLYGEYPLERSDEEDTTLEKLTATAEVGRLFWGLGEALPLSDDVILPPSEGEMRVVCAEGKVMMSEATPMEGNVHCRGEVTLKLTLCPAESEAEFASETAEGRVSPTPTVIQRKIPFTQAVEVAGVTPACAASACGYCTDISVEMEDGHIHVEMAVVTEARAQKNESVAYVADLYSTRRRGVCRYATHPTERSLRALNGNFTLSDSLPLAEVGIDPATKVVDVTATAMAEGLTADRAKGRCLLTGTCHCHLLLLREGEYASADMEFPFRYEFDDRGLLPADGDGTGVLNETASDGTPVIDEMPVFDGRVTVVNCRARMDGERVGVDAELAVSVRTCLPSPVTVLSEADFGDEVSRRRGEYVICFPAPTDTLWSVAKRYHAPMAALTAVNNLPTGVSCHSADSLEGVGYLIV